MNSEYVRDIEKDYDIGERMKDLLQNLGSSLKQK